MANLRDIINAATPGPWSPRRNDLTDYFEVVHDQEYLYLVAEMADDSIAEADAQFIAAYSPDHALLIEAVIESAPEWRDEEDFGNCWYCGQYGGHTDNCRSDEYRDALAALAAYRKERGLNG